MANVMINGTAYVAYADVAYADTYLAADAQRAEAWDALADDPNKGRSLVTATRQLQSFPGWIAGVPDVTAPPQAVKDATAILAADISADPSQGDSSGTGSNIKRVNGKQAEVEFFRTASPGLPFTSAVYNMLVAAGLIAAGAGTDIEVGAIVTGADYCTRFTYDRSEFDHWDGGPC